MDKKSRRDKSRHSLTSGNIAFLIIVGLLTLALVSGCSSSTPPEDDDPPISTIMPLKAGNKWVYDATTYNPDGTLQSTRQDSIVIATDTIVDYEQWFLNHTGTLMRNQGEGLWTMIKPNPPRLLYKYPASSGDNYLFGNVDSTQFRITVMATDELVTLPLGDFDCVKFRQVLNVPGPTDTTMIYVAPDTGLVLKVVTSAAGVLRARLALKNFSLQ
jgi:hypothetical protein